MSEKMSVGERGRPQDLLLYEGKKNVPAPIEGLENPIMAVLQPVAETAVTTSMKDVVDWLSEVAETAYTGTLRGAWEEVTSWFED